MRIVEFPNSNQWLSRPDIAKLIGVTERTISRQVDAGKIIRRQTPNGNLYILAGHGTGQDMSRESPAYNVAPDTVRHTGRDTRQDETSAVLEALITRMEKLENTNARLLARIEELEANSNQVVWTSEVKRLVSVLKKSKSVWNSL